MSPDWLGSPQHFVAGLLLAPGVCLAVRRRLGGVWRPVALATSTPPYLDTLADLGTTLAGAVVRAAVAAFAPGRRDERHA